MSGGARSILVGVFVACVAAAPAHARAAVRVWLATPSTSVPGSPVAVSGLVTGPLPRRASVKLQLRASGRWTAGASARLRGRAFTLRWTPPATVRSARLRVVVTRGRKRVAASPSQLVTLTALATTASEARCVTQSKLLSTGGDQDWSPALDRIAYSKPDAAGNNQLRVMNPDGTGDVDISSAARAVGVRIDRHKSVPVWEPAGRWIVVQVEGADWYPGVDQRDIWLRERAINGVASSLWAVSPNGSRWVRLTNEAWPSSFGAMAAHFSRDGRRLLFSRLVEPAGLLRPWGVYRLILADFAIAPDGTPSLVNHRDITPAGHPFAEAQAFSPSGTSVLFASYGATDYMNMDIWSLSLSTGATTRLTTSPLWDEHATYSPSGQRIVYFAGELGVAPMTGDLMSMNPDGSGKARLSAFNRAGAPGYSGAGTLVMRPTFNADGTRMAVTEVLARDFPAYRRMSVLTLSAAC